MNYVYFVQKEEENRLSLVVPHRGLDSPMGVHISLCCHGDVLWNLFCGRDMQEMDHVHADLLLHVCLRHAAH